MVLRLPFRFGVVTLTQCPQAFARARIELEGGKSQWGAAAEMMAPKWFDKNLQLSNEDNFEQLRDVLLMARQAYLSDASSATAFGHFARHHDSHLQAASAKGYNPLLASYGPALIDRAILDALCRAARRFLLHGDARQLARHRRAAARVRRLRLRALPAGLQPSSTHRSAPHRGHAGRDHGG